MAETKSYVQAVGRRKEAVARVRIFKGAGPVIVNGKPVHEYFQGSISQKIYQSPFALTKKSGNLNATIKVLGGGTNSQLEAVVHGIARALTKVDMAFRPILKKNGMLTRDARAKERRKYGLAHKARAKKQSPKR